MVKKMDKSERKYVNLAVAIVALLMLSSTVLILKDPQVSAQASLSDRVNPITGLAYGDPLQYDWPRIGPYWGGSGGNDETSSFSSTGPGPNTPNIMWSMQESSFSTTELFGPDPQDRSSDLGTVQRGPPDMLIAGYAFYRSQKGSTRYVNALDPYTGALEYQIVNPGTGAPAELDADGNYFRLTISGGWAVYDAKTGNNVYNVTPAPSGTWLPKMGIAVATPTDDNQSQRFVAAYDHSEEFRAPDGDKVRTANNDEMWSTQVQATLSYLCADPDNKVLFYGSWYDRTVWAFNATDGKVLWTADTESVSRNALYIDGRFILNGLHRGITCFNTVTGEKLWDWFGGERTYFGNSGAAGDGLCFFQSIDVPTGWTGCWNILTGELLWKVPGFYYIGYYSPAYADGKLYCILADGSGVGGEEYESYNYWSDKGANEYGELSACIDAMTGEIIFKMPFILGSSRGSSFGGFGGNPIIAYGCMWIERWGVSYCIGDAVAKDWVNFRGSPDQNAVSSMAGPTDLNEPKWSFTTGESVSATPVVADGKVFIGSWDRNIYCLDAYTGQKIWNFTIGYKVQSTVAYDDGKIFTGTDDGVIYCIDADTGDLVWSKDIGGKWEGNIEYYHPDASNQPRSSPIVVGNKLYVGAKDGKVYCLTTAKGDIEWSFQTLGPVLGSPMYYDGVVYITSTDVNWNAEGRLFAFDAQTGTFKWAVQVPGAGGAGYFGAERGINAGTPTVANIAEAGGTILLVGNTAGVYSTKYIHGFNLTTGERATFSNGTYYSISGGGSPAVWVPAYRDNVIYSSSNLRARATNATNGGSLWEVWMVHNTMGSPLVTASISGTYAYFTSDAGILSCNNANPNMNGTVVSSFISLGLGSSSPAIWEGKIYIGHGDHNVYCFDNAPLVPMWIYADIDKGDEMWQNETLAINGKLYAQNDFYIPANEATGTGAIEQTRAPGIPGRTVTVVFVRPDLSDVQVTATTDSEGYFTVQYSPDVAGNWSWTAFYDGEVFANHAYSYTQAYTDYYSLNVLVTPSTGGQGGGEQPPPAELDMMYVYAAIAVIIIVIAIVGAYFFLKRGK
jgi:outer membrane protein assembly factor BamB